jgi:hypothetical protein
MRLLICALSLVVGCADADKPPAPESVIEMTGRIGYGPLDEASGLAQSQRRQDLLWAVNDGGRPVLYGIGVDGAKRGKVEISKAGHRDWEDLAAFTLDSVPYLLVADIGDNNGNRRDVTLYVVEEPAPDARSVEIAWRIDFSYPEGPRDAEAVAVDTARRQILVLSKRDIPARLYALPLKPGSDEPVLAEYLGVVDSLPQPSRRSTGGGKRPFRPTSMDIAADDSSALILTYRGVYFYSRNNDENWSAAFRRPPLELLLRRIRDVESITFGPDTSHAFVTAEGRNAPIVRIDLTGVFNQ